MLLGALLAWGLLGPLAQHKHWAPGGEDSATDSAGSWVVWVALAVMMADSLTSLALVMGRGAVSSCRRGSASAATAAAGAAAGGSAADASVVGEGDVVRVWFLPLLLVGFSKCAALLVCPCHLSTCRRSLPSWEFFVVENFCAAKASVSTCGVRVCASTFLRQATGHWDSNNDAHPSASSANTRTGDSGDSSDGCAADHDGAPLLPTELGAGLHDAGGKAGTTAAGVGSEDDEDGEVRGTRGPHIFRSVGATEPA